MIHLRRLFIGLAWLACAFLLGSIVALVLWFIPHGLAIVIVVGVGAYMIGAALGD